MALLKNIIFDLGAVLINIDYKKTEKAFIDLGYENFEAMYSQLHSNEIFEKLETGKISNEDFYNELIALNPKRITPLQIKNAWNEILLDWRKESLRFLEALSTQYQLFLLSNTNAIHQKAFNISLIAETGRDTIDNLFTKAYYSHEIHLRKPNADIFEFLAKDAGINIMETLFIDDSSNNIDTAKQLGFKTHLLLKGELIEKLDYTKY
jgi:glucose-1-phosphatase